MNHLEELKNSKNFEEVIKNVKKIKENWKSISEEERNQIIRFDPWLNFDVDDKLSDQLDDVIPEKDNVYGAIEAYKNGIRAVTTKLSLCESLTIVIPAGVRYFNEKFKSETKENATDTKTTTEETVKTTKGNTTPTSTEEVVTSTEGNATTTSQK